MDIAEENLSIQLVNMKWVNNKGGLGKVLEFRPEGRAGWAIE